MSKAKSGERSAECTVVQASKPFVGKQGFTYAPAVSAQTVGASGLHMQLITMPPGARAKTHKHEAHETAIYVLSGESGTYYGEQLEHHVIARAGDFLYMPPTCLTCPIISARPNLASRSLHEPTRTIRKVSY